VPDHLTKTVRWSRRRAKPERLREQLEDGPVQGYAATSLLLLESAGKLDRDLSDREMSHAVNLRDALNA